MGCRRDGQLLQPGHVVVTVLLLVTVPESPPWTWGRENRGFALAEGYEQGSLGSESSSSKDCLLVAFWAVGRRLWRWSVWFDSQLRPGQLPDPGHTVPGSRCA